jgi:peptidoglycan/LPS O-acetylase OafA/YrhL
LKYRAEIDGLRALAVVPVILFHAGFELFSGGFVGVDVFFVISGYLITTILIEDIENKRFSIVNFYERRARRILPALTVILLVSTLMSYLVLYPTDFEEYSKSLLSVVLFASNIFFWSESDYFATAAELTPLLHTWSLAVEEQYYVLFPIFLILAWRFGKNRVFWMIVVMTAISLLLSEWGWRNQATANFYLAPTRAWELFAGSIAAFIVQKQGVQKNNLLATLGLAAIIFSIFFYDETTPFPSVYALVPVLGVVLLVLYADKETVAAKLLSTRGFVGIGLISYSAYLWHQPLMALYRRKVGIELSQIESLCLIFLVFLLSVLTWKYVENPFRKREVINRKVIFLSSITSLVFLSAIAVAIYTTNGASFRFQLPSPPQKWADIKCHGSVRVAQYDDELGECLGLGAPESSGDIYLLGDSHAAQITFALRQVAKARNVNFYFINTESGDDFPYSFLEREVSNDRILSHVSDVMSEGDFLLIAFHRGRLNPNQDSHFTADFLQGKSQRKDLFTSNMVNYLPRFASKNINIGLVKDGPLLSDSDTMLEACMYEYLSNSKKPCQISFLMDDATRTLQSQAFDYIAEQFSFVTTIDYLPELYVDAYFSPISDDGEYLMFDRHHLTVKASLLLEDFFQENIRNYSINE